MDKAKCGSCSSNVMPRLFYHNVNSLFFNRSQEHVCPLCGDTMYVSGGGISPLFKGGLILVGIWLLNLGVTQLINEISNKPRYLLLILPFFVPVAYFVSKSRIQSNKLWFYVHKTTKWLMVGSLTFLISILLVSIILSLLPFNSNAFGAFLIFVVINIWVFKWIRKIIRRNQWGQS